MRKRVIKCLGNEEKWVVFVAPFEHHSNILSWRESLAEVAEIGLNEDGMLDMEALKKKLEFYRSRFKPHGKCFNNCISNLFGSIIVGKYLWVVEVMTQPKNSAISVLPVSFLASTSRGQQHNKKGTSSKVWKVAKHHKRPSVEINKGNDLEHLWGNQMQQGNICVDVDHQVKNDTNVITPGEALLATRNSFNVLIESEGNDLDTNLQQNVLEGDSGLLAGNGAQNTLILVKDKVEVIGDKGDIQQDHMVDHSGRIIKRDIRATIGRGNEVSKSSAVQFADSTEFSTAESHKDGCNKGELLGGQISLGSQSGQGIVSLAADSAKAEKMKCMVVEVDVLMKDHCQIDVGATLDYTSNESEPVVALVQQESEALVEGSNKVHHGLSADIKQGTQDSDRETVGTSCDFFFNYERIF